MPADACPLLLRIAKFVASKEFGGEGVVGLVVRGFLRLLPVIVLIPLGVVVGVSFFSWVVGVVGLGMVVAVSAVAVVPARVAGLVWGLVGVGVGARVVTP